MTAAAQKPLTGTILENVETFEAGQYPGDEPGEVWTFKDKDVDAIVRNFARLSDGENPIHRVPVVVTHDGVHAYGWVIGVRRNEAGVVLTDWKDVVPALVQAAREKRLPKVSAEIKRDFTDNDGTVYPGPYLYRVAVIGADVPRVKGLADIPAEQFADRGKPQRATRVFAFADSGAPVMTVEEAKAFLLSQGYTEEEMAGASDGFLIAVATDFQDATGGDQTDKAMLAESSGAARVPGLPTATPKKMTMHFAELGRATLSRIEQREAEALKRIEEREARALKAREDREVEERVQMTQKFCERMRDERRIDPAEVEPGQPRNLLGRLTLIARQPQAVQEFSEGGKQVKKTLLELEMEEVAKKPAMKFAEKGKQAPPGGEQPKDPFRERMQGYYDRDRDRERQGNGAKRN